MTDASAMPRGGSFAVPPRSHFAAARRSLVRRLALLTVLGGALAPASRAQCPDGTPPPCARPPHAAALAAPAPNSVAVLAFDDATHDTSLVWLGDGLAEEVATELGAVPGVVVRGAGIVRSASRATSGDPRRIAQLVSVRYVVEGSFRNVGPRVHVAARLLAMPAGDEHWGRVYDRPRDSLATLAGAMASDLATALGASPRLAARRAPDPQAYEDYQRGRFFFLRNDYSTARVLFERAIRRDSAFAPAWAAVATTWGELADVTVAPLEGYPKAREAAHRALALDSTIADAYAALSGVAMALDQDCPEALRLADRAVALDSARPDGWIQRSLVLACLGRGAETIASARHGWELDSLSGRAGIYLIDWVIYFSPEHLATTMALVRGRLPPEWARAYDAGLAIERGDCAGAAQLAHPVSAWLYVEALTCLGRRAEADSIVRAEIADTTHRYVNPVGVAWQLVALGDRDGAIQWLERGAEERTAWVMWIHVAPELAALRGDPRFVALERRLGLEP